MAKSLSTRILVTPSSYAKQYYFYLQEIGTLTSMEPHISRREGLNSFLFIMVMEGHGYVTQNGKRLLLSAGDCAFLNCYNTYSHESSIESPWTLKWIHYSGKDAYDFYLKFINEYPSIIFHPHNLTPYIDVHTALYQTQQNKSSSMELLTHKYITDFLVLIMTENKQLEQANLSLTDKLQQVRAYLVDHYQEKITLEDLSALFYISKYHLLREYKKTFGLTINNDLTEQRISHAKSYLRFSDHPIEKISELCGFSEVGYFIKVFKNIESTTPLSYRKKWQAS